MARFIIAALCVVPFIADVAFASSMRVSPETPYELGILRGTSAVTHVLQTLSAQPERWGPPISDNQRSSDEFRRLSSYRQLSYGHWGYVYGIKSALAALAAQTLSKVVEIERVRGNAYRAVSPEVHAVVQRFGEALRILSDPKIQVHSRSEQDRYLLGHEVFMQALQNKSAEWQKKVVVEMAAQAGALSSVVGFFMKRPAPSAVADAYMAALRANPRFTSRADSDHDAGVLLAGRILSDAMTDLASPKFTEAETMAYRAVQSQRRELSEYEDDFGIRFISEDDEVILEPNYFEFHAGYKQAIRDLADVSVTTLSEKVFSRVNLAARPEVTLVRSEIAQAMAHFGFTKCGRILGQGTFSSNPPPLNSRNTIR